jgi:hypothetical protein
MGAADRESLTGYWPSLKLDIMSASRRVRLFTRRGYDWIERHPLIRKAVKATPHVTQSTAVQALRIAAYDLHENAIRKAVQRAANGSA